MKFEYLQSKPGIVRVLFVVTSLIGTVITSVATSKSKYIEEGLARVPYDPGCPPAWLAKVALVLVIVSLIFSIAMLILSVALECREMNGFKTVDFWGHLICAVALVMAFVFITAFVIMSVLYSPSFCKPSGNKGMSNKPGYEVTMMSRAIFGPFCQIFDQIKENLFQPTLFGIGGVLALVNFSLSAYITLLSRHEG